MASTDPPAPPIERPRYHHGDLRGALIAAGREILEQGGLRALTLREAARRAGVSHAAPRHHFGGLAPFLAECAGDGFVEFDAALRAGAAPHADPVEALAAMARAYVGFAAANRTLFRLMFDRDGRGAATPALVGARARACGALVLAVRKAMPEATGQALDYAVASVWAIVHGYATLMLEDQVCLAPAPGHGAADYAARAVRAFASGR